jgi:hypothetical protein
MSSPSLSTDYVFNEASSYLNHYSTVNCVAEEKKEMGYWSREGDENQAVA